MADVLNPEMVASVSDAPLRPAFAALGSDWRTIPPTSDVTGGLERPASAAEATRAGHAPVASTPDELGAAIKAEIARLGRVIKDIGLRAD